MPIEGLRDALGHRAKIGILVPATNTIVEPELAGMQPPGVTNHVSRMGPLKRDMADLDRYRRVLGNSLDMEQAIDVLAACEPDIVVHGHSLDSFALGLEKARNMQQRMEIAFGGAPVVIPSLALLTALAAIGSPRSLGILTPYMQPGDEVCSTFFTANGYRVAAIKGLRHPSALHIATATSDQLDRAIDEINVADAECIVKVGTNSAIARLVPGIERRIGKPVLAVNTVIYWAALRQLGIMDPLAGYGSLAEAH
jgi:maleate isomerase